MGTPPPRIVDAFKTPPDSPLLNSEVCPASKIARATDLGRFSHLLALNASMYQDASSSAPV
jgi:hypothetical protein